MRIVVFVQWLWLCNVCGVYRIGPEEVIALSVKQFVIGVKTTRLNHIDISRFIVFSFI